MRDRWGVFVLILGAFVWVYNDNEEYSTDLSLLTAQKGSSRLSSSSRTHGWFS
ncbi:MAG TPA: hypothetical protein VGO47_13025 [Chlamydiales bacterium]|nr:hypothetical protein [Chlamydiales bacterium]